jgi:hypothetical protein
MSAMPSPAQSEFSEGSLPVKPSVEAPVIRPADLKRDRPSKRQQPLGVRMPLAIARFLITFCVGVAATLAWQSYGDAAREMIANASPQLGWLAPAAAPVERSVPDTTAPAAPTAAAADPQQFSPVSADLDAVRQSVDRIVAGQEQITRTVDQLAAGQEQMVREINKMQAIEQYILYKNSEAPPRPAAPAAAPAPAPNAPKPAPRPAQTPAVR